MEMVESEDEWVVITDASYKDGASGIGVTIFHRGKEYTQRSIPITSKGPQHAELTGIYRALSIVDNYAGQNKKIVVYCDSAFAVDICNDYCTARTGYIVEILEKIREKEKLFTSVTFEKADSRTSKRVDKLSKAARKVREKQLSAQSLRRKEELNKNFKKAGTVKIIEEGGNYYAVSSRDETTRYMVSLNPVSCECPWFTDRWVKVPNAGVKKYRIPCKHICALSKHLSRSDELLKTVLDE